MELLIPLLPWAAVVFLLGNFICFLSVLIKLFQSGEKAMGIASIVLLPFLGLGGLIAFIAGWVNSSYWRNRPEMIVWACCIIGILVTLLVAYVTVSPCHHAMIEMGMGQLS